MRKMAHEKLFYMKRVALVLLPVLPWINKLKPYSMFFSVSTEYIPSSSFTPRHTAFSSPFELNAFSIPPHLRASPSPQYDVLVGGGHGL
jgi:hypothetical protein